MMENPPAMPVGNIYLFLSIHRPHETNPAIPQNRRNRNR